MNVQGRWITAPLQDADAVPEFLRSFKAKKRVARATLSITALGVYEAWLNGSRVGRFVLAPGWTAYQHRIQVQRYDVTALLAEHNELSVLVGRGWYASPMGFGREPERENRPRALLAWLCVEYEDGTQAVIGTDESWLCRESAIRKSEIYDGETFDATFASPAPVPAQALDYPYDTLIEQEGEEVREQERVQAQRVFTTPQGDVMVDFGQEVTGYVAFSVPAKQGDEVLIQHAEVLDRDGNFYNENYRSARAEIRYICKEGLNVYHPRLTFFGFRMIRLTKWPQPVHEIRPEQFTAIAVYSAIRRTGHVACSNPKLNQFFSNVFWGQRGNFLDVPTDCPQRDERLGWTGDAQVFCKAASYNFDVYRFLRKWLHDLAAEQLAQGGKVGHVIPDILHSEKGSAAWGDVATVIPWQLYMTYGREEILAEQYASMRAWVDYITKSTTTPDLWTGGEHYGDWLGLDAPQGSYKGSSREDFIASAFYAHSTALVVKAGRVLGEDTAEYEALHARIVSAFHRAYPEYRTQTECVLALHFGLAEDEEAAANRLCELIRQAGHMETGFVGTPYLLHVLSAHGHTDLAYNLLLREAYPSWLYAVGKGATTVWEHWDGILEDGTFWSKDMNSFNHYAYGSVIDWVYERAAGIQPAAPGFACVTVAPEPTDALDWLEASIDTPHGRVSSRWAHADGRIRYEITLPVAGEVVIDGEARALGPGSHVLWGRAAQGGN